METGVGTAVLTRAPGVIFWSLVVLFCLVLYATSFTQEQQYNSAAFTGAALTVFGVTVFVRDGGSRVTALGLFNFSAALFAGLGAVYSGVSRDPLASANYLAIAALAAFVPQVLVTALAPSRAQKLSLGFPDLDVSRWALRFGTGALVFALALKLLFPDLPAFFLESAAFTSITVIAVALVWRADARLLSLRTLYLLFLVLVYTEVFHSGSGRLRIVALVCVIGVLFSSRYQTKILKWVAVFGLVPALWWLAQDRKMLQESLQAGASVGRNGLESMLGSMTVFSRLIESNAAGGFALSYGKNLLSFPATLVPKSLADELPQALGYELVKVVAPERYNTGFSVVATNGGEAYFNFGFLGLLLMVPVLALFLRLLDRMAVNSMTLNNQSALSFLGLIFWVMLIAGVSDLAWSGQHTFLTRAAARLPVFLILFAACWISSGMKLREPFGGNYGYRNERAMSPRKTATAPLG